MSTDTPHDSLFRYAFSQPSVAADHFRAMLPEVVVDAVRWETLAPVPGSFVDEDLKQVHSDVLYRAELTRFGSVWIYVLFEHQSTPDARMAWRLLRYMVRIWDRFVSADDGPLPVIAPMVLYNGERPWNVARDFHGLFPGPEDLCAALLPGIPQYRYELMDLSRTDDDELQGVALRRLVLLLLKHAHEGDFWERLPAWLDTLEAVVRQPIEGLRALEAVWRYVVSVTPRDLPEEVRALLVARLPPEGRGLVMSWGQRLEERGREQGRQEGLQQGRREGTVVALITLLRARFGEVPESVDERVRRATDDELERWTRAILTAESLEALFV